MIYLGVNSTSPQEGVVLELRNLSWGLQISKHNCTLEQIYDTGPSAPTMMYFSVSFTSPPEGVVLGFLKRPTMKKYAN